MDLPNDALVNFIFPNNQKVWWSLMIVIYPYITGLIAGAFVVSALHHVVKMEIFRPISRLALIAAFCFGMFAGLPLLVHLGQPQRALEIYITPHTTSAMSVFGYVYGGYMVLLAVEIWLMYRQHFIRMANSTTGWQQRIWTILCLGVTEYYPDSAEPDRKVGFFLATVGIAWAFVLHGYVGFVFGSVKAIAWWSTALQPIIFLASAVVSGIAMLQLMFCVISWKRGTPIDYVMVKKLMTILWAIFLVDWGIEMLEVATVWYADNAEWGVIRALLLGPLRNSYIIGQIAILSFVPAVLLGITVMRKAADRTTLVLANVCSFMLLLQVLFMRFNVVIGGQLISKSERGFVDLEWSLLGENGILTCALILAAPFVAFYIISRFIPVFEDSAPQAAAAEQQ